MRNYYIYFFLACLTLIALLLLVAYWKFEFLENSRMYRMGWRKEAKFDKRSGYPLYMAWAAFALTLSSCVLCLYAHYKDIKYVKHYNRSQRLVDSF